MLQLGLLLQLGLERRLLLLLLPLLLLELLLLQLCHVVLQLRHLHWGSPMGEWLRMLRLQVALPKWCGFRAIGGEAAPCLGRARPAEQAVKGGGL